MKKQFGPAACFPSSLCNRQKQTAARTHQAIIANLISGRRTNMNQLKQIFYQLFNQQPLIIEVPNWSHFSPEELLRYSGPLPKDKLYIGIAKRADAQLHFYNDAFQSHSSNLVTSSGAENAWYSPMEEITRKLFRSGHHLQGYNLYFLGAAEKKKGRTYEMLLKIASLQALSLLFQLDLSWDKMVEISCDGHESPVPDALFLRRVLKDIDRQGHKASQPA